MNDHTHVMTEEEWAENKDCAKKKRDHKWHWKHDITTGLPHPTAAICVHCGRETELNRDDMQRGVTP